MKLKDFCLERKLITPIDDFERMVKSKAITINGKSVNDAEKDLHNGDIIRVMIGAKRVESAVFYKNSLLNGGLSEKYRKQIFNLLKENIELKYLVDLLLGYIYLGRMECKEADKFEEKVMPLLEKYEFV